MTDVSELRGVLINLHHRLIREAARNVTNSRSTDLIDIDEIVKELSSVGYENIHHTSEDWRVQLCINFINDDDYEDTPESIPDVQVITACLHQINNSISFLPPSTWKDRLIDAFTEANNLLEEKV